MWIIVIIIKSDSIFIIIIIFIIISNFHIIFHWEIDYRKIIGIYQNFDGKLLYLLYLINDRLILI